jgi:chromosome segregation ATPase
MAVSRESSDNHLEEHIDQLEKLLKGQNNAKGDYSKLDIDAIKSEIQSMQTELHSLSQESNVLQEKYFKLESSCIDYKAKLEALEQEVDKFQSRDEKSAAQAKGIVYNFLYIILSVVLGYYAGQIGKW